MSDDYGLSPKTIERLKEVFSHFAGINKVILYGSRAKGNFRPGSDIDLTIKGAPLTVSDLVRLDEELDNLLLPQKIDLSEFSHLTNAELITHIERVGKVIYQNDIAQQ